MSESIDRSSGELLPGVEEFVHHELAAFTSTGFRRNQLAHSPAEIAAWRTQYGNTGVFRTVLASNHPQFLRHYREPTTLFYGDLCFDFDIETDSLQQWPTMIESVASVLLPSLQFDLGIPPEIIRIWFSGARGLHIEVPATALEVWPHHELHKVYGFYAKTLKEQHGLQFLDLSLYAGKHLYRLEHSVHQRSGLYKWPLAARELGAAKDLTFLQGVAKTPRRGEVWKVPQTSSAKARAVYLTLFQGAVEVPPARTQNAPPPDTRSYDRSRYVCIQTLLGDSYLTASGNRNTTAFVLASHLRQNGFSYDQAEQEMLTWAKDHCDPPFMSEDNKAEWYRALSRVYTPAEPPHTGCSFIQQTLPHLCQEQICPVGIARLRRKSSRSLSTS